jgi:hypothetical protein
MAEVVIDTNVLLVAEGLHDDVSPECVLACVERLQAIMKSSTVVIDDAYRVIGEYQNKLDVKRGKGVGAAFLKWLVQNQANAKRVARVALTEMLNDHFAEFPVPALQTSFDPSDRKFPAVANAHPAKPPILQAVDSKWLRWWPDLAAAGIQIEFMCPDDICRFFQAKFPAEAVPALP